jgi:hypothetical protein
MVIHYTYIFMDHHFTPRKQKVVCSKGTDRGFQRNKHENMILCMSQNCLVLIVGKSDIFLVGFPAPRYFAIISLPFLLQNREMTVLLLAG